MHSYPCTSSQASDVLPRYASLGSQPSAKETLGSQLPAESVDCLELPRVWKGDKNKRCSCGHVAWGLLLLQGGAGAGIVACPGRCHSSERWKFAWRGTFKWADGQCVNGQTLPSLRQGFGSVTKGQVTSWKATAGTCTHNVPNLGMDTPPPSVIS